MANLEAAGFTAASCVDPLLWLAKGWDTTRCYKSRLEEGYFTGRDSLEWPDPWQLRRKGAAHAKAMDGKERDKNDC